MSPTGAAQSSTIPIPNFDRLARPYRWLEYLTFGPCLQRCRLHYLAEISQSRHALVLGDGDGRFTARLLQANPIIDVHAVDASPEMLQALRRSTGPNTNRLTTEAADLRYWQPPLQTHYDLVVAHFFLDCLTTAEIERLACRLSPALSPSAVWLVSDFAIPATSFGRAFAAPLVAALYRAFRVVTNLRIDRLPDHCQALRSSEWSLYLQHGSLNGLLTSQLWKWTALRDHG